MGSKGERFDEVVAGIATQAEKKSKDCDYWCDNHCGDYCPCDAYRQENFLCFRHRSEDVGGLDVLGSESLLTGR